MSKYNLDLEKDKSKVDDPILDFQSEEWLSLSKDEKVNYFKEKYGQQIREAIRNSTIVTP